MAEQPVSLSNVQRESVSQALGEPRVLTDRDLLRIANRSRALANVSDDELVEFLRSANAAYRAGDAIVSNQEYDHIFRAELVRRHPNHPYLNQVEPDVAFGKTVELPQRMLSTQKAYSKKEVDAWLAKIGNAARDLAIPIDSLKINVTPKLDGYAAYDDGVRLYSRGDGKRGTDISRAFERGLRVGGDGQRGHGAGEVVIRKSYFEAVLLGQFDNSRNVQAAILAEKNIDPRAQEALDAGAALFMPFSQLERWSGSVSDVTAALETILEQFRASVDFDLDGLVIEVTHPAIKQRMGSARSHHRWQLAFKINDQGVPVTVTDVEPNTSRLGRVNPVAIVEPVKLSGVVITRVTAHHYGMVSREGIGPGAIIRIVRSGLVIPKIEAVVKQAQPKVPGVCPSCGSDVQWEGDFLFCRNSRSCPAQASNAIEHFFKTLDVIDGFGPQTIDQLYGCGVRTVSDVYRMGAKEFEDAGFATRTAMNLSNALQRSRRIEIQDSKFLAAFGVHRLGEGNAEKLLARYSIEDVFDLSAASITAIPGFAEATAVALVSGLADVRQEYLAVSRMGFNIKRTPLQGAGRSVSSAISGKTLVFTGTMAKASRDELEKEAKSLGAVVGSSVSGKTSMLVIGDKPGASKVAAARARNIEIVSEDEYRQRLSTYP